MQQPAVPAPAVTIPQPPVETVEVCLHGKPKWLKCLPCNGEPEPTRTAIGKLYTSQDIEQKSGVPAATLIALAAQGLIPHYRVKGSDQPLFKSAETKTWIAENLYEYRAGEPLPAPKIFVLDDKPLNRDALALVPASIATIRDLKIFDPCLFVGIYFLCLKSEVVYVGQSTNIAARVSSHATQAVKEYDAVYFLRVPAAQLDEVEKRFIRTLKPLYNRTGKPSKDVAA